MPKDFDRCVSAGGRVRTLNLKGNKYIHICYKNGKSYRGYVKTKGESSNESSGNKYTEALKK